MPGQCLIRTCDRTITGRRLRYARALQIIQTEEYLTQDDLDEIRRKDEGYSSSALLGGISTQAEDDSSFVVLQDYDGNILLYIKI